jgi:hypothetical protein
VANDRVTDREVFANIKPERYTPHKCEHVSGENSPIMVASPIDDDVSSLYCLRITDSAQARSGISI